MEELQCAVEELVQAQPMMSALMVPADAQAIVDEFDQFKDVKLEVMRNEMGGIAAAESFGATGTSAGFAGAAIKKPEGSSSVPMTDGTAQKQLTGS